MEANLTLPVLLVVLLAILVFLLVRAFVRRSRSAGVSRGGAPVVDERERVGRRRSALTVTAEIAAIVGTVVAIVALVVR